MKQLTVPKGSSTAGGSCWYNQSWLFFVVVGSVVAFTYFVGVETKEGPIQVVGVVEKDHTKKADEAGSSPVLIPTASQTSTPPPTVPIPVPPAPLPSALRAPTSPVPAPMLSLKEDLSKIENLVSNFELARGEMVKGLKEDYGEETYKDLFIKEVDNRKVSLGKLIFKTPSENGPSMERFKSKMMRKLLLVMLKAKTDDAGVRFVWATGGHSATAGHGNLYDESYTAFLERTVKPVFAALGMDFVGRNYAMGGTGSAPETALCIDSIFGATDPDILVWDHGMTDGRGIEKMLLYFYRAGLNRNRPAVIANHLGGKRHAKLRCLPGMMMENRGLAALCSEEDLYASFEEAIPDSLGKGEEEVKAMPKFVRNYKCGNLIEKGDPYCGAEKYNDTHCAKRRFKAGWHPGWKWHGMQGHILAVFLVDLLEEAARAILARADKDPQELYNELQQKEDEEYEQLQKEALPDLAYKLMNEYGGEGGVDLDHVFKTPAICHTGKVPAEIRHKGILTEGPPGDLFNHPQGISQIEADIPSDSEFMPLVREDASRQSWCDLPLNMDHKDFFYVHERDGWKKLLLPNDAEIAEYGRGQPLLGLIAVCFQLCPWGKCPKGNLLTQDFREGKGEIQVNGAAVVNMTAVQNCEFLRGEQGHYWPQSPTNGKKYEIRVRATEPGTFVRIASVIIW